MIQPWSDQALISLPAIEREGYFRKIKNWGLIGGSETETVARVGRPLYSANACSAAKGFPLSPPRNSACNGSAVIRARRYSKKVTSTGGR